MTYDELRWHVLNYNQPWWTMMKHDDLGWNTTDYDEPWWTMMTYEEFWWTAMTLWWTVMNYSEIDDIGLHPMKIEMQWRRWAVEFVGEERCDSDGDSQDEAWRRLALDFRAKTTSSAHWTEEEWKNGVTKRRDVIVLRLVWNNSAFDQETAKRSIEKLTAKSMK